MKRLAILYSCMLLCCNAVLAGFSGSDDFNDENINTNLWDEHLFLPGAIEETFVETNGHLHFTSTNIENDRAVLPWKTLVPFYRDWTITVTAVLPDFENSTEQQYGISLMISPNSADQIPHNHLALGMSKNEDNQKVFSENYVTNDIEGHDLNVVRTHDTALLRLRWETATSNLYSEVSLDAGSTWTNYWGPTFNPFEMTLFDYFSCSIYGSSKDREISISDNLYLDDFLMSMQGTPTLSGADGFNDNTMDSSKWTSPFGDCLSETNSRVEYSTPGINEDDSGMWLWMPNAGSCTQDWYVTIEAYNSSTPTNHDQNATFELAVFKDWGKSFWAGLAAYGSENETDLYIDTGWNIGDDDFETLLPIDSNSATLRISFDSTTKTLTSHYDLGSGFVVATNFSTANWGLVDTDHLNIWIVGFSDKLAITSGQIYADNFKAVTLPSISNHLESAHLFHTLEFGEPTSSGDDHYEFDFKAETDDYVSNILFTTPAAETVIAISDGIYGGEQTWRYETAAPAPLTNRFGIGDYTINVTYSNGLQQSTIIPFPPLVDVTMQPLFTAPAPLHDTLFSATDPSTNSSIITLEWEDIDANANVVDLHRHHVGIHDYESLGLFTDLVPFADGPLSTRSVEPTSFTPGEWEVEFFVGNAMLHTNADGIASIAVKQVEADYAFTVLYASEDEDGDGLPNWWESLYFAGPSNCVATSNFDNDVHNNMQEFITGMDPTNALSCFKITNCVPLASDFLIEWPSVSGRVYSTYWTTNLMNSFQPLETGIEFPINSCTDIIHSTEDKCFYRVDVQME